jgi:hypothetical protein
LKAKEAARSLRTHSRGDCALQADHGTCSLAPRSQRPSEVVRQNRGQDVGKGFGKEGAGLRQVPRRCRRTWSSHGKHDER